MGFLRRSNESVRDKTRDEYRAMLQDIGIDAQLEERGRDEEKNPQYYP